MAKVRVYELARELDIESKKLVDKLVAGGMNIKNYMSTLDEEAASRAREIVSGVVSEVIEEQRVKPTVIRRRKKIKIQQEPPEEKIQKEAKELPESPEAVEFAEAPVEIEDEAIPPVEPPEKVKKEPVLEETPVRVEPEEISVILERPEETPAVVKEVPSEPETKAPVEKAVPKVVLDKKREPLEESAIRRKKVKSKGDEPAKVIKRPEEGPLKNMLARQAEKKAESPEPLPQPIEKEEFLPVEPVEIPDKAKPAKKKKEKKKVETKDEIPKSLVRRRKKEIYERDDLYKGRPLKPRDKKSGRKVKESAKGRKQTEITVPKASKRRIRVPGVVTVVDLAKAMGIKAKDLIKALIGAGVVANINQSIEFDTACVVADDFGFELELDSYQENRFIAEIEDKPEDLKSRPPVVTIMGHVDHGKTSLLDYIRKSNIIGGESGGITQHIGAYYVERDGGDIVFLDTPGHEAFTSMRARGAKVTDIIVLVVAADDGVMPQTKEAINHARAAEIPIVLAINKMDKAEANPDKVKRELAEFGLAPEEWGGDTLLAHISAKTGEGVDELMNLILLQAEMLELKGNPSRKARGTIIEASLDKSKGPLATVLIKNGTLLQGDHFVCGEHYGRVRAMLNHRGKKMKSAGPSAPAEIYGISGVPMAGDEFIVVKDEKTAKQVIEHRKTVSRKPELTRRGLVNLDDLFERMKEGDIKELNIILKTDVQGSLEALSDSLLKQSTNEVKLNIIHLATGGITESDVMLASASGAIIIGFNVRANPRVSEIAEREKVDIRYYDVIYNVINDIRLAMTGLLEPVYKENIIGRANVKEMFRIPKVGGVAGCQVMDGRIARNSLVRLLRDDVVIFDGKIASLRRFKEDVKEVQSGYECGISLENFDDIKPGDVFEVYEMEQIQAEL